MRNLVVTGHRVIPIKDHGPRHEPETEERKSFVGPTVVTFDPALNVIYYATPKLEIAGVCASSGEARFSVDLGTAIAEASESPIVDDTVISLQYIPDQEWLVAVTSHGFIIRVSTSTNASHAPLDDVETPQEEGDSLIEVVGCIEGGLSSACWSPDKEILAITSNSGTLMMMSKTWDLLLDTPLQGDDASNAAVTGANPYNYFQTRTNTYAANQHTQLSGAGKSAEQTLQTLRQGHETDATISWRADGRFVVVSSVTHDKKNRVLRVWDRQGQLQSVSELHPHAPSSVINSDNNTSYANRSIVGMHPVIRWRPSGNLIAGVQRGIPAGSSTMQQQIIFFEKNGLRHGEFDIESATTTVTTIPSSAVGTTATTTTTTNGTNSSSLLSAPSSLPPLAHLHVTDLQWSADSEILAVVGRVAPYNDRRVVQLWTMNNYQWYLKQQIELPSAIPLSCSSDPLHASYPSTDLTVMWHPERPSRLMIFDPFSPFSPRATKLSPSSTSTSSLMSSPLPYSAPVIHSLDVIFDFVTGPAPNCSSLVIDGTALLITHMAKSNAPPPLATRVLRFPQPLTSTSACATVAHSNLRLGGEYAMTGAKTIYDRIVNKDHDASQQGSWLSSPSRTNATTVPSGIQGPHHAFLQSMCSPSALKHSAPGKYSPYYTRLDVCAPLVAMGAGGDLYFPSEALADLSPLPLLPKPCAPTHQPERFMGLTSNTRLTATHPDLLSIPASSLGVDSRALSIPRHLTWLDSSQWLALHYLIAREIDRLTTLHGKPPIPSDVSVSADLCPTGFDNTLAFIRSAPSTCTDTLVLVRFRVSLTKGVLLPTSLTVSETPLSLVLSTSPRAHPLTPPHILPLIAQTEIIDQEANSVDPTSTSLINNSGTTPSTDPNAVCLRVAVVSIGAATPLPPDTLSTEAQSQWLNEYAMSICSAPWLSILLSDGSVIACHPPLRAPHPSLNQRRNSHTLEELSLMKAQGIMIRTSDEASSSSSTTSTVLLSPTTTEKFKTQSDVLTLLGRACPPDCHYYLVRQFHKHLAHMAIDLLSRMVVNRVVVAPQCLSFNLIDFKDTPLLGQQNMSSSRLPDPRLPSFLLITVASQQHAMFTLDLQCTLAQNIEPTGPIRGDPHSGRIVERGARIVSAIPDYQRPRVVLQMPRGNLETIQPRALGLAAILATLERGDYLKAFLSMRTNRIDLNLLYDHSPTTFLRDTEMVVSQLSETPVSVVGTDYLSLFLSSLTEDDSTDIQFPIYRMALDRSRQSDALQSLLASHETEALINRHLQNNQSTLLKGKSSPVSLLFTESSNVTKTDLLSIDGLGDGDVMESRSIAEGAPSVSSVGLSSGDGEHKGGERPQPSEMDMEALARGLQAGPVSHVLPAVDESDVPLGAEANAVVSEDGTGLTVPIAESRVSMLAASELDLRHVYAQAVEEQDAADAIIEQSSINQEGLKNKITKTADTQLPTCDEALAAVATIANIESTPMSRSPQPRVPTSTSKVNVVCRAVLAAADKLSALHKSTQGKEGVPPHRLLIPSLTACLRQSPPNYVEAMQRISQLAADEALAAVSKLTAVPVLDVENGAMSIPSVTSSTNPLSSSIHGTLPPHPLSEAGRARALDRKKASASDALKYVLMLADSNELWKAALSLYDLTLAASVAEHAGRDPKEYLPFLSNLEQIALYGPPLLPTVSSTDRAYFAIIPLPRHIGIFFQRAWIDTYLDRPARALIHLANAAHAVWKSINVPLRITTLPPLPPSILTTTSLEGAPSGNHDGEWVSLDTSMANMASGEGIRKLSALSQLIQRQVNDIVNKTKLHELAVCLFAAGLSTSTPAPSKLTDSSTSSSSSSSSSSLTTSQLSPSGELTFMTTLVRNYAAWLCDPSINRPLVAAEAYEAVDDQRAAADAEALGGYWDRAIGRVSIYPLEFDEVTLTNLAHRCVKILTGKGDHAIAASIQFDYLNDLDGALVSLVRAEAWDAYLSLLTRVKRPNLVQERLIPALTTLINERTLLWRSAYKRFPAAARRLRIVRRVKLLILTGRAKPPSNLPNTAGYQTKLVMRIPGDDVLEFILTGVWKGQQTGLITGSSTEGDDAQSIANSLSKYSTVTGASLLSLAPSIAQSVRSSRIAGSLVSTRSTLSNASSASVLTVAADAPPLTADELRILKHQQRVTRKKGRKKVKEGDPREEAELVLELRQLTPKPDDIKKAAALIRICRSVGLVKEAEDAEEALAVLQTRIKTVERIPMPLINGLTEWQTEQIVKYFNWPASNHIEAAKGGKKSEGKTVDDEDEEDEIDAEGKKDKESGGKDAHTFKSLTSINPTERVSLVAKLLRAAEKEKIALAAIMATRHTQLKAASKSNT